MLSSKWAKRRSSSQSPPPPSPTPKSPPFKDDAEKLERLIEKIEEPKTAVGIKKSIREYGIYEKEFLAKLDEIAKQAFDDRCTGSNPRYPLISEIKEIYLKAYYG